MFHQLVTPVAGSLPLSFLVAAIPIATVLLLLGVLRRPAWQASAAGLACALLLAAAIWKCRSAWLSTAWPQAPRSRSGR
jgi:lactate permease